MSEKRILQRLEPTVKYLSEVATEEGVNVLQLCGRVIQRLEYIHGNRQVAAFGKDLFNNTFKSKELDMATSVFLKVCLLRASSRRYQMLQRILKAHNMTLPPMYKVIEEEDRLIPKLDTFSHPDIAHAGVSTSLRAALKVHVGGWTELLDTLDPSTTYVIQMKAVVDGAGDMKKYQHIGGFITNIISAMYCILRISNSSGDLAFKEDAPNSPDAQMPFLLVPDKESKEVMAVVFPHIESEKNHIEASPLIITHRDQDFTFKVEVDFNADGKSQQSATGVHATNACISCDLHQEDMHSVEKVQDGMPMNRDMAECWRIFKLFAVGLKLYKIIFNAFIHFVC